MLNLTLMGRTFTLIRNISSNFVAQIILFFVGFLAVPVIFQKFGSSPYGTLALLNTIIIYFTVVDFGILASLIKHIAQYRQDTKTLEQIINTSFTLYTSLVFIFGLVILSISHLLIYNVLKIPAELKAEAVVALQLGAVSFVLSAMATFFSTIPQALHRFDIFNVKSLLIGVSIPIGTIILLLFHKGLKEIVYLYIFINGLAFILFYFIGCKLIPEVKITFGFSLSAFKQLFSFGWFKFVATLSGRLIGQLNEFLIGVFLPVRFVGFYSMSSGIAQKITEILPNISSPLFPLSAELDSLAMKDKLVKLYSHSIKLTNLLLTPIALYLFFFAKQLLTLWVGQEVAIQAGLALRILSLAYLINSFAGIPSAIIEGMGKPKVTAFFSIASAFSYIILALLLIPKFGLIGAALTVLINGLIQSPIFVIYTTTHIININNLSIYWEMYLKPFLVAIVSVLPLFLIKFTNLWQLISLLMLYLIICGLLSFISGVIDSEDKQILRKAFAQFYSKIKR